MARDLIHNIVKETLVNEGWKITHDPYPIKIGGFDMEIDLGAENMLAAERENSKIAIEVKSFVGLSKVYDFHQVVGQFVDYRIALRIKEPERLLFVAVTDDVYDEIFIRPFAQMVMTDLNMKLIVVNPITKTIVQWIN